MTHSNLEQTSLKLAGTVFAMILIQMLLLKIVEKLLDKHARLINISNIQRLNLKLNLGLHLAGLTNSIKIKIKLYKSICKEKDNHKKEIYERQFKTYHHLV